MDVTNRFPLWRCTSLYFGSSTGSVAAAGQKHLFLAVAPGSCSALSPFRKTPLGAELFWL